MGTNLNMNSSQSNYFEGVRVVSLDAYDTLLPVEPSIQDVASLLCASPSQGWRRMLWKRLRCGIQEFFEARAQTTDASPQTFVSARRIYEFALKKSELAEEIDVSIDEATEIIAVAHSRAKALPGASALVEKLKSQYWKVVCTADADNDFLAAALKDNDLRFKTVLTSEMARGYKADKENGVFDLLLKKVGVSPSEIVHIGDSRYDIIGSSVRGIRAVLFGPKDAILTDMPECPILSTIAEIKSALL